MRRASLNKIPICWFNTDKHYFPTVKRENIRKGKNYGNSNFAQCYILTKFFVHLVIFFKSSDFIF